MSIITLFITYLITPFQIKCQIPCPPGSDTTEIINLDGALVDNDPAITSGLKGGPNECAGTQEIDGWSYTNDGSCLSNDKVNWYFMGAVNDDDICNDPPGTDPWYECITPDIVNSGPGEGPTGCILVGCLQQIEFTLRGTISDDTDGIFMKVYTKTQEGDSEGNTRRCWHKSRLHIPATSFSPIPHGATFNEFTTFTSDILNILNPGFGYAALGTGGADSNTGDAGKTLQNILDTEEIRAIAFSTNSGATQNTHDWTLLDFTLTFDDDCTCPTMRTYNLAAVPGPFSGINTTDVGNDCSDDIGTCDECTCKYKCIHQDGVNGTIQQIPNINSQESCCALCGNTSGCLAYTYILDISGVSSECGETYAIGDCLLYDNKLTECSTESTQLRYEGISGSIVDGICDINSIVGDCCEENGECIMEMCTAPTAAPTLNPTGKTSYPTLSPTDSDDDSMSFDSSESSVESLEEESDSSDSNNKPTTRPTDRPIMRVVSEEENEEETDVNSGVDNESRGSSDDDSGDDVLFGGRLMNKHGKYDIKYNINNNTMIRYEEINLSESIWINIWGILGVIVIINIVLIWIYYYKHKTIIQTLPL